MSCKIVQNPKQFRFKSLYKICHAFQCDFQQFCYYDQNEQGCKIIQYVEPQQKFIDQSKVCFDVKRFLNCDKYFNKYGCLYLTDIPCYFDSVDKTCKNLDQYINTAKCDEVSSLGCTQIKTIGQNCFILLQDVVPYSCNFGLKQFKVCQNIDKAPKIIVNSTTEYSYNQCEYFTLNQIMVNPNTCSQLQNCKAIFDLELEQCVLSNFATGCTNLGQTEQLCEQNKQQGCSFNKTINSCQKTQTQIITEDNNCSSIITYTDKNDLTRDMQPFYCVQIPNCAFYNELNATKLEIMIINSTYCEQVTEILRQNNNASLGCHPKNYACWNAYWNTRNTYDNDIYTQSCRTYQNYCQSTSLITDENEIIQTYFTMPERLCTQLKTFSAQFINSNYTCLKTEEIKRCTGCNKMACLIYSKNLNCIWQNEQCQKLSPHELKGISDCSIVNLNSCYLIGAICQIQNQQCQNQMEIGSCDSSTEIQSEFTCSQLTSNQCFFNTEVGFCQQINNYRQLYNCKTPGLNYQACLINTKEYCKFENNCQQIIDLTLVGCEGLNIKGCVEHTLLACIWDNVKLQCSQVQFSTSPTCNQFQSIMPSDYYVNAVTCYQITTVPCIYVNQQCQIPLEEKGCNSQIYNYKGCIQSTNELCQVSIGKVDYNSLLPLQIYCVEIGDFNQGCSTSFNKYACIQMIGCLFKDNVCQQYKTEFQPQILQLHLNPYICQNAQGQTLIYKNFKCDIATDFYECQTPFINQETCLQKTLGYCQYIQATEIDFNDTEQRCIKYQSSNLFSQQCHSSLNFNVCADVENFACVFKQGVCQQFDQQTDTCQILSQNGVYASIQACAQTKDVKCAYDNLNKRCQIIQDYSSVNCDTLGVNQQLCVQVFKLDNKCEFITTQFESSIKQYCDFATKDKYNCFNIISMNQCILIDNCKFQNNQCQNLDITDSQKCIKEFQVNGQICSQAQDVPCDYDQATYKCVSNPSPLSEQYEQFNSLACINSQINKPLVFKNNKCQLVSNFEEINCSQDLNQFSCKNAHSAHKCIFKQKCGIDYSLFCEQNQVINNPKICELTTDIPCKYSDTKCVPAQNSQSECLSQGLNILACLQSNLINCDQCTELVLNSKCIQAETQSLCLSLFQPCIWQSNKCLAFQEQGQHCEKLPDGINKYVCFQINMQIDQECIYDQQTKNCVQQIATNCENLNSLESCTLNTLLKCVWMNEQCIQKDPTRFLDKCGSYRSSLQYCKAIDRFDSDCEFINGVCQGSQYQQPDWQVYVNRQSCIKQRYKYCYWENTQCLCANEDQLLQLQSSQTCNQQISFLLCLSIITQDEYCQFIHGQCNKLILLQNFTWNQYALINPNVCTQVTRDPVNYDDQKYICRVVKNNSQDCETPGLNKLSCLSIKTQSCRWINNKCKKQISEKNKRILIEQDFIVNPFYCSLSQESVYYQNDQCQPIDIDTQCDAIGISKSGCLNVQSEPCRWYDDDYLCELAYPIEKCELNPPLVNPLFCSKVEIGSCKYDENGHKCVEADSDSQVVNLGLNQIACIQIHMAVFDGSCKFMKDNQFCPIFQYSNPFACKQAIDNCVYDPIDRQCQKITYSEDCDDLTLSKEGCQQLQLKKCVYFDIYCTCNSLISIKCLYTEKYQCQTNNLCYWEDNNCKVIQCSGLKENCQIERNCYQRIKDKQAICDYAAKCEDIQYDNTYYKGCSDIIINNVPCVSDMVGCKTFQCSSLQKIECVASNFGQLRTFDYCVINDKACVDKQCVDIQSEAECVKRPDCFYFLQINQQWGCKQFTQCSQANQENICNQIQIYSNMQYIPCSWINEQCVLNPCPYLGIDKIQCNGVHINNKYVCALDQNSVMCNVCEMFLNGCDCLSNDKYCEWDINLHLCQSLPCQKILSQNICELREDCKYEENTSHCKTRCQFHFNKYYCNNNDCYWDDYESKCSSCDINSCKDYECLNTYCCQMKFETEYGTQYHYCSPRCEKMTKQQCYNQCTWSSISESCIYPDPIKVQDEIIEYEQVEIMSTSYGYLLGLFIIL